MKEKFKILISLLILSLTKIDAGVLQGSVLHPNLIPTNYKLRLSLTRENFLEHTNDQFEGIVKIYLKATSQNIRSIILNRGPDLSIQNITLEYPDGGKIKLVQGKYSREKETQEYKLIKPLPYYKITKLLINYKSKFGKDRGFFRLMIKEDDKFVGYMLATHGQPDFTRMIFPCFDEPTFKAKFQITISFPTSVHGMGYHALSNAEISSVKHGGGLAVFYFKQTPKQMSTYLVAIIVSKYNQYLLDRFNTSYPNATSPRRLIEIQTWADPYILKKEHIRKVHGESGAMMNAYIKKFEIGYPLNKLDQVIAAGFPFFGMENYGLVFYKREKLESSSIDTVRYIQAHELAHQWFGNLVTLKDWTNDFWVQEGFAHYFAKMIPDEIRIDGKPAGYYDHSTQFVMDSMITTLRYDSRNKMPPVSEAIKTLFEGSTLTVMLTYDKAASLIRMLKLTYGSKVFDKAMQMYFHFYRSRNAGTNDLFHCFDLAVEELRPDLQSTKPSQMGFEYWIKYKSFPFVNVTKDPNQPNTYILTQEDIMPYKTSVGPIEKHEWTIPITYSTSKNRNFNRTEAMLWLHPSKTAKITLPEKVDWIVLNHQYAGYYRVFYDKKIWKEIIKVLNDKNRFHQIHELNRVQIIEDALDFAFTRRDPIRPSKYHSFLSLDLLGDLFKYLAHEDKYHPWQVAIYGADWTTYNNCRFPWDCEPQMSIYLLHPVVEKKYEELKNNPAKDPTHHEKKLRELIKDYYCKEISDERDKCYNTPI